MASAYFLTEKDKQDIADLLYQQLTKSKNIGGRGRFDDPDLSAPDVYIARTGNDGVPALAEQAGVGIEDQPGQAECSIYRILDTAVGPRLFPIEEATSKVVYNLSNTPIGAYRWVKITRDKTGRWLVSGIFPPPDAPWGGGGDTGTGTGTIPGIPPDINPGFLACSSNQFYIYRYYCEGTTTYDVTDYTGTGTTGPILTVTLSYLNEYRIRVILFQGADGCVKLVQGNEQFVRTIGCCDTRCADRDWYCVDPPTDTGTSTSTSTGGEGTISTTCCPLVLLPTSLTISFSNKTGDCTCLPDSAILTYNSIGGFWENNSIATTCVGGSVDFRLMCISGAWSLMSTVCGTSAPGSVVCDPLQLTWTGKSCLGRCTGTFDIVITL